MLIVVCIILVDSFCYRLVLSPPYTPPLNSYMCLLSSGSSEHWYYLSSCILYGGPISKRNGIRNGRKKRRDIPSGQADSRQKFYFRLFFWTAQGTVKVVAVSEVHELIGTKVQQQFDSEIFVPTLQSVRYSVLWLLQALLHSPSLIVDTQQGMEGWPKLFAVAGAKVANSVCRFYALITYKTHLNLREKCTDKHTHVWYTEVTRSVYAAECRVGRGRTGLYWTC